MPLRGLQRKARLPTAVQSAAGRHPHTLRARKKQPSQKMDTLSARLLDSMKLRGWREAHTGLRDALHRFVRAGSPGRAGLIWHPRTKSGLESECPDGPSFIPCPADQALRSD